MDHITAISGSNSPLPKGVSLKSAGRPDLALVPARACALSQASVPLHLALHIFFPERPLPFPPGEALLPLKDPDLIHLGETFPESLR